MTEDTPENQAPARFRAILHPHRSLGPSGFLILMLALGTVSFIAGMAFLMMGAWPVFGFFGLDVLLVYIAFKLNYRSGRTYELVELTSDVLSVTHVEPSGKAQRFEFSAYWVRVRLSEEVDGRTYLKLASHGKEFEFGRFLTDDEKRDFAKALSSALTEGRMA
jgi:uncharacterized membrane protein